MKLKETLTKIDRPKLQSRGSTGTMTKYKHCHETRKWKYPISMQTLEKKLHERQQKITFDDYGAPDIINIKLRRDLVQG